MSGEGEEDNMATYQLTGSVINGTTQQGIAALGIEAWGKPGKARKKLAPVDVDSAHTLPPCISAIRLTVTRPRPLPG